MLDKETREEEAVVELVRSVQRRAKSRTLTDEEVRDFMGRLRRAMRWCIEHGLDPVSQLDAELDGGAVPTSYRYRAETTLVRYHGGRISVTRARARTVPYGDSGRTIFRLRPRNDADRELFRSLPEVQSRGGIWKLDI